MPNTYNYKTISTNLNTSPWYDDYDAQKNYYKVVYKPGLAVQIS